MKTAAYTMLFLIGFSLTLVAITHLRIPPPAHAMTFEERAGHMFDGVQPGKEDRLPSPDLKGGALIDGNPVHALIFRPDYHPRVPVQ
jgi:hypothetical protein